MKSLFNLILCFVFFSNLLVAQKTATVLFRPPEYERPTGQLIENHLNIKKGKGTLTAMSDRDENPLYETASKSSNKLSSLKFLDPLYIIGEEGAFFKVAQFKQEDLSGNVLKNPKNIGYVDKSTLILWKKAIYNDKGFVKKAL